MKGWSAFPLKLAIFRGLCSAINTFSVCVQSNFTDYITGSEILLSNKKKWLNLAELMLIAWIVLQNVNS